MDDILERFSGRSQKELLTSQVLRRELGDERRSMLLSVLSILVPVALIFGFLLVLGMWFNIPVLVIQGLFLDIELSYNILHLIIIAIILLSSCVAIIRYVLRLHKARDVGMKISVAKVSSMRHETVGRGRYAVEAYYLIFPVYGEVCLQGFDYEFTDHPMVGSDLYYSTSGGDEFYLISFKNNGDVIKVFPAKYFELSEELKEWLR